MTTKEEEEDGDGNGIREILTNRGGSCPGRWRRGGEKERRRRRRIWYSKKEYSTYYSFFCSLTEFIAIVSLYRQYINTSAILNTGKDYFKSYCSLSWIVVWMLLWHRPRDQIVCRRLLVHNTGLSSHLLDEILHWKISVVRLSKIAFVLNLKCTWPSFLS